MTVIDHDPIQDLGDGVKRITWRDLAPGDEGQEVEAFRASDKTVHVEGINGHAVTIEGRNFDLSDGVPAPSRVLQDPHGDPMSFVVNDIRTLLQNPWRMKPVAAGGSGLVTVSIIAIAPK